MYKYFSGLLFFCSLLPRIANAQIFPGENSKLNYRLIGFSFPAQILHGQYTIEIAAGTFHNEDSFKHNIIARFTGDTNRIIGEVPAFGCSYTWRSISPASGQPVKSGLHHFSTLIGRDVDTTITRLRVLKHAEKYADAYVFMDGTKALYDMNGKAVWFLPQIDSMPADLYRLGDLKMTPSATITFMSGRRNAMIYEVDYNNILLWKGPYAAQVSGEATEHYNHEFTKLNNGHYMVLGYESLLWKLPGGVDSATMKDVNYKDKLILHGDTLYQKLFFYTVIEYNEQQQVVWALRTSRYFKDGADTMLKTTHKGIYDEDELLVNSVYFDEADKAIYLSFRNMARIFKVQYPDGTLLNTYGNLQRGITSVEKDLFCWQHACGHSPHGYIYMFNNNICHPRGLPKVTVIQDLGSGDNDAKKIWEYECAVEDTASQKQGPIVFSNGGSVTELPDSSMFVCMSNQRYTKVFIVNWQKEILWSALCERWDAATRKWQAINQYRASIIINREGLERLIWNSNK